MKSGTSWFNKSISANFLKRCWPVWTCWLVILLFALPMTVSQGLRESMFWDQWHMPMDLWMELRVLESACTLAKMSFFASIVPVMAMFSFLYNSRTCNMMCSLPVKRETLFTTAWLTGLTPMLAAEILTALLTALLFPGTVSMTLALRWLGIVAAANIGFYGFGAFCAMLTGSLFILPLVYAVLSLTAFFAEVALKGILNVLVYGAVFSESRLMILSPFAWLIEHLHTFALTHQDEMDRIVYDAVQFTGGSYLIWFCLSGLVFSVLALLLFRKRRMETASDTVAVPVLKPVFKYCMAFGCALVLSVLVYQMFLEETVRGTAAAVTIGLLMVAGAFIGWFAAKMIIRKSMRVFREDWKGFVITAAVCLVFVAATECDVTGYEKRLPDLSKVESVELSMRNYEVLKERENIEAVYALQQSVLENKKHHEAAPQGMWVSIRYFNADGSEFVRNYRLAAAEAENYAPESDVLKAHGIENSVEAVLWHVTPEVPVSEDTIYNAAIYSNPDLYGNGEQKHPEIPAYFELTPEEAEALYRECILPDVLAGRIYDTWIEDLSGVDAYSGIDVSIDLMMLPGEGRDMSYTRYSGVYVTLPESATLTIERIAEIAASR